jgi:cytochrome c oxidase subunit 3
MHVSTLVIALMTAIVIWVFIVRKLTAKPWVAVNETTIDQIEDIHAIDKPAPKLALWIFFCCISSLFALFITAYAMRMNPIHATDWTSIDKPQILWLNTIFLILGSLGMQWSLISERRENIQGVRVGLFAGGILTTLFILGQLIAWQQLRDSNIYNIANPAVGFFYLLTAIHGLHLIGGLYVWAKATLHILGTKKIDQTRLTIELCTTYWHYLLLVWFILFWLLLTT